VLFGDDAHWLDQSTAAVLTFIARRLESESVGLLDRAAGARPLPYHDWGGIIAS
jgi:hypothetical protein